MPLSSLRRLFARAPFRSRAPACVAVAMRAAPVPAVLAPPAATAGHPGTPDGQREYLRWLLGWPAGPRKPVVPLERVLALLDPALSTPDSCARLLRRAPNVVPRLVQTLNSDVYSRDEVVLQVERDPVLTTEVLRVARSVLYRREPGRAPSIGTAVGLLGSSGLKQVIHRALVRPLYSAEGNGLQSRASARLWEESERCARLCVALARDHGVDIVDAYLAGLLHNTGWSAVMQALDACGIAGALHQGLLDAPDATAHLLRRHDLALARLLVGWNLSPELTALACDLEAVTLPPGPSLARVLAEAQQLTMLRRLQDRG
jgi:HD-like signal output (HDOD) protein